MENLLNFCINFWKKKEIKIYKENFIVNASPIILTNYVVISKKKNFLKENFVVNASATNSTTEKKIFKKILFVNASSTNLINFVVISEKKF